MPQETTEMLDVAIIGAGPAGLMAAEVLAEKGLKAVVFDAMPTPARKLLMAGKSGLNITYIEALNTFVTRYGERAESIRPALEAFTPDQVRTWADGLGAETFTGSSRRVFPRVMKASPLLRAWLARLSGAGVILRPRHRWTGWGEAGTLLFTAPEGLVAVKAKAVILALGGTSWPRLGADGSWQKYLTEKGVEIAPFRPANCGFNCHWSPYFIEKFAGTPVKNIILSVGEQRVQGDFVISKYGIEGSAVYGLAALIRDRLSEGQNSDLQLDLVPGRTIERLKADLAKPKGKKSFATHLKRVTGLAGVKAGLVRECVGADDIADPNRLAMAIKSISLPVISPRPVAEAISVAGGVSFSAVDSNLMLKSVPGIFCAGEMLDWEAPTGGYLITACLAQGKQAAEGAINWLQR
ncbi:TIGR03862 family flavoprotein [Kordiimonas pumila]|uniref:TIGR03862 family flavoprotein n=1 Tax=Kordiimonas pumila TaxID=2161677 RepID=A0ABV7D071_9PROT|nr:TIGR03862 family flavoprotein [Kordiimonas pumila]